jgi:DtxR family Mn-dependent transcriptional regulator
VTGFYLLVLVALAALWAGLRWQQSRRVLRSRQRVEDALKHLFEQEYRGRRATMTSLAGLLRLPDRLVVGLVARMEAQDLLTSTGQEFTLTPRGRQLASQIVRAHRLLERYFADEARLPLRDVHAAAERREHSLSPTDVERLAASLGHPSVDPHGDPIPTPEGAVAPASGTPATSWPARVLGRVVHLEDEPEISFAQIVAAGIRIGQSVRIIESTPERIVMSDGENEFRLAPAVAANVFLAPAPEIEAAVGVVRLSDLDVSAPAVVVGLDPACQGFSRRRLMDLGFTEGARVQPRLQTFAGDPRAYEVRGTLIALRRDQASQVLVRIDDGVAVSPGSKDPGAPPVSPGASPASPGAPAVSPDAPAVEGRAS